MRDSKWITRSTNTKSRSLSSPLDRKPFGVDITSGSTDRTLKCFSERSSYTSNAKDHARPSIASKTESSNTMAAPAMCAGSSIRTLESRTSFRRARLHRITISRRIGRQSTDGTTRRYGRSTVNKVANSVIVWRIDGQRVTRGARLITNPFVSLPAIRVAAGEQWAYRKGFLLPFFQPHFMSKKVRSIGDFKDGNILVGVAEVTFEIAKDDWWVRHEFHVVIDGRKMAVLVQHDAARLRHALYQADELAEKAAAKFYNREAVLVSETAA